MPLREHSPDCSAVESGSALVASLGALRDNLHIWLRVAFLPSFAILLKVIGAIVLAALLAYWFFHQLKNP